MSRRMRLQFEAINLLAALAMVCLLVLGLLGKVDAETVMAGILGIAVPGHAPGSPPGD